MNTHFLHPRNLSESALIERLQARWDLVGYARWVKLLEQCDTEGVAELVPTDWTDALRCGRAELDEFLAFCQRHHAVTVTQGEDTHSPLRVVVSEFEPYQLLPTLLDRPVRLPQRADEWRLWCSIELSMPNWLLDDPATQQLFRRWCASNVTVTEMEEAAKLAAALPEPKVSPAALHDQLQVVRRQRLAQAYE